MPKNADFFCEKCCFRTHKKSNFEFHMSTLKHKNVTNVTIMLQEKMPIQYKCVCNKLFNNRTSLWRHKKICFPINKMDDDSVCFIDIVENSKKLSHNDLSNQNTSDIENNNNNEIIKSKHEKIDDYELSDIEIIDYKCHDSVYMKMK